MPNLGAHFRPGSWAYADGMELGRMSSEFCDAEDRTIFGWYVITSSPLYLGHNISDDAANGRVWPIVSNREAIRINQQWIGHPGRLVKTWDPSAPPVSWAAGRGVYNVSCEATDGSQLGWSYDASTSTLRFGKDKCLDPAAADNRQIWVSDCDNTSKQMWRWGPRAGVGDFAELYRWGNRSDSTAALSVPGAQNSVGFGRKGSTDPTTFRINPDGQLQVNRTRQPLSCLAARAINPIGPGMTYELWTKPLADGSHAVLLVNNGEPANVTYGLRDLGLSGAWTVRDVWAQTNAGHISGVGSRTVALGVHASALHVLRLPPPPGASDPGTTGKSDDGFRFGPSEASLRAEPIHGDAIEYQLSAQN